MQPPFVTQNAGQVRVTCHKSLKSLAERMDDNGVSRGDVVYGNTEINRRVPASRRSELSDSLGQGVSLSGSGAALRRKCGQCHMGNAGAQGWLSSARQAQESGPTQSDAEQLATSSCLRSANQHARASCPSGIVEVPKALKRLSRAESVKSVLELHCSSSISATAVWTSCNYLELQRTAPVR